MTEKKSLEERICDILLKKKRCWCPDRPPYCSVVYEIALLVEDSEDG